MTLFPEMMALVFSLDDALDDGFQEPTEQDLVIEEEDGYCWNEEK